MNILDKIVATKREEIAALRRSVSMDDLERRASIMPPARGFRAALERGPGLGVIAEVKRASPSAGLIKADFDPVAIARAYADAGASCISVLTDEAYFQGHLRYLEAIRRVVEVPLLRKDFLLDRVQLLEARLPRGGWLAPPLPPPRMQRRLRRRPAPKARRWRRSPDRSSGATVAGKRHEAARSSLLPDCYLRRSVRPSRLHGAKEEPRRRIRVTRCPWGAPMVERTGRKTSLTSTRCQCRLSSRTFG